MLAAAALLTLAIAGGQAPSPDEIAARAPSGAAFAFMQACLLRLNVKQSPAAYAAGSAEIGRGLVADNPGLKGLVTIDGADGEGCRVVYRGERSDEAWTAFSGLFRTMTAATPGGCTAASAAAPNSLAATCVAEAAAGDAATVTRRGSLVIARIGPTVTATLTPAGP